MPREVFSPTLDIRKRVHSIEEGGTAADTPQASADKLSLVKNSQKDQVGGVLSLNSLGQLPSSRFTNDVSSNVVNVSGPSQVTLSTSATYTISDYDSARTYVVSASAGTVTISADTITFVAPNLEQTVYLTVNGRQIPIAVSAAYPTKPSVTSPVNGSVNISATGVTLTSSAYVPNGDTSTHQSSDWQIATDINFTSIAQSTSNDTVNKTSWTTNALTANTAYYARVRHKSSANLTSPWSDYIQFTSRATGNISSETNKLTAIGTVSNDNFGSAIDLDSTGTTMVTGMPGDDANGTNAGAALIHKRSGSSWSQVAKILAVEPASSMSFNIASGGSLRVQYSGASSGDNTYLTSQSVTIPDGTTSITLTGKGSDGYAYNQRVESSRSSSASFPFGSDTVNLTITSADPTTGVSWAAGSFFSSDYNTTINYQAGSSPWNGSNISGSTFDSYQASISVIIPGYASATGTAAMTINYNLVTAYATGASTTATFAGQTYTFAGGYGTQATASTQNVIFTFGSDQLGNAVTVSSDGTRVAIAAMYANIDPNNSGGAVYIFHDNGTSWALEQKIIASDIAANDLFGRSLSFNDDATRLIVGSPQNDAGAVTDAGAAYIFTRTNTLWAQEAKLIASDKAASDFFGYSVSIDSTGARTIIGAYKADASGTTDGGAAYVFTRTGTSWAQEAKLVSSDLASSDYFGSTVAISGDGVRALIGSPNADPSAVSNAGAAYVFTRSGVTWTQETKLLASDGVASDTLGTTLALSWDGSAAVVGTQAKLNSRGAIYLYTRTGTTWSQAAKFTASDAADGDSYSGGLASNNNASLVAVGAPLANPSGVVDAGAVYIYR